MSDGKAISGRKKNEEYDFYETPEWATEKAVVRMLEEGILKKSDDIYEPCCGAGAISRVLHRLGFEHVRQSDIQDADFISGYKGIDVFALMDGICDVVFTNPPYNLMTRKAKNGGSMLSDLLRISRKKVVILSNVYFLSSKERKELLENSHLRRMYIHSDRVTMFPYGEEKPKNGGTKMFVWLVFDKEYNGEPTFCWI